MKFFVKSIALATFVLALCSCAGGSKNLLPNISGKAGEVLVVAEKADWEGIPGTLLRDSLGADCPFLPMKEPLYSLTSITPSNFTQMFQIHRNIIILYINPAVTAPGVDVKYDKWARPQIVIQINATSSEEASELLQGGMHTIIAALEQKERDRVIANTRQYQERDLPPVVEEFTGGQMVFPSGWKLKKHGENFLWISYETTYLQQGIFIYKYPAEKTREELSAAALVERRNAVMMDEVPGMREGSYMTTSPVITPSVTYMAYHGRKFAQMRGFWDVHGDFMGGPFVSHTFYTPDGANLVCIEGYVYAPKYDKRLYLRQVESLLYSFEWDEAK